MKELSKNAIGILGKQGENWLNALPKTIQLLSEQWGLKDIIPVENMSYNYVAKATQQGQPVVLKIAFDQQALHNEKQMLSYFNGHTTIQLLGYNELHKALLLAQAVPGITLRSLSATQKEFVINCYADTVKSLLCKPMKTTYHVIHLKDWLKVLDNFHSKQIPNNLLRKAFELKNFLLATLKKEVILHGDLHLENILKSEENWIVIDPKGVIGEPEFEVAAFDFVDSDEIENANVVKELFNKRVNLLAERAELSAERIKNWVFVRLILSAVWSIEDKGDPNKAIGLAKALFAEEFRFF